MQIKLKKERVQKVLAQNGLGSRRFIEKMIQEQRITVNGQLAVLGQKVSSEDKIKVDHHLVKNSYSVYRHRMIAYYKPEGEVCTHKDEKNRITVFHQLPKLKQGRWISVGRLDIKTTGLLLFTTNGELAHHLMHPSTEVEREYIVRVFGEVTEEKKHALLTSVQLSDGRARFTHLIPLRSKGKNQWFKVCLQEGRHHEVRRLWESQNIQVNRLKRVRFGNFSLPRHLSQRAYYELTYEEMKAIEKKARFKV